MVVLFSILAAVFFGLGLLTLFEGNGGSVILLGIEIISFLLCLGFTCILVSINGIHERIEILEDIFAKGSEYEKNIDPNRECICSKCGQKIAAIAMKKLDNGRGVCPECYNKSEGKW